MFHFVGVELLILLLAFSPAMRYNTMAPEGREEGFPPFRSVLFVYQSRIQKF